MFTKFLFLYLKERETETKRKSGSRGRWRRTGADGEADSMLSRDLDTIPSVQVSGIMT